MHVEGASLPEEEEDILWDGGTSTAIRKFQE